MDADISILERLQSMRSCAGDSPDCVTCKYFNDSPCSSKMLLEAVELVVSLIEGRYNGNLNDLRDAIYADAVAHGLWNEADNYYTSALKVKGEATELVTAAIKVQMCDKLKAPLCHDEFMQAYQHDYEMELADCIIMALSVAGKLGIDIDAAMKEKMEVNRKRAWQHKGE